MFFLKFWELNDLYFDILMVFLTYLLFVYFAYITINFNC